MIAILSFCVYLSFAAFAARRMLTYMHALQQDDYDGGRLLSWMITHKVFDKRLTLGFVCLGLVNLTGLLPLFIIYLASLILFSIATLKEKDPRKQAKKKLVLTTRAKRIYVPALLLSWLIGLYPAFGDGASWSWIICIQAVPFLLILVKAAQDPYEKHVQKKYWNEAHAKLKSQAPTVIGITGSFGKTSIKHIVGHILRLHAPTLITPGSVNTPMGITRIIREQLDENHQYFIVEMGAYGQGSISRLCDLAPPDYGIIASIGHAHYERFKTLDMVAQTKFELAEAVMAKGGQTVIHESTLSFDYSRTMQEQHPQSFIICGETDAPNMNDQALNIKSATQKADGLHIQFSWQGKSYSSHAPLYGLHHAHNVVLAFACAMTLGLEADDILKALKNVPQISHRLEVKPQPDGTTIIDDAFNSNPVGFRGALDVLGVLKDAHNKRAILITPGMVEMGEAHDQSHTELGRHAGNICDVLIAVTPERVPTLIAGFKETGGDKPVVEVATFAEASAWLQENKQDGDIILLENDLPDLYERIPVM